VAAGIAARETTRAVVAKDKKHLRGLDHQVAELMIGGRQIASQSTSKLGGTFNAKRLIWGKLRCCFIETVWVHVGVFQGAFTWAKPF
jgi:hypothetical protein